MKERMRNKIRWLIEILVLAIFIGLTISHKLQLWFVIFLLGVIISIFAGRYYCGWICPMNTIFRPVQWVYKRLKIIRFKSPKVLSNPWSRYLILILFLSAMVMMKVFHIKINLLLYITMFSIVVTLFFEETFWHRHICPFGTILSITSRRTKVFMEIEETGCISCGACQKKCPSGSIITREDGKRYNQINECLLCYQCIETCPTKVCQIG